MKTRKPTKQATRVADHRKRIEAEGGKQVAVMLSAEAAAKLEAWGAARGWNQTETINRLLTRSKP